MQKSCLEYIMTSVSNPCASSHSQKPGAPDRDPKSWGCRGFHSVPAILFVFFLFSPDTALKVWHRFPASGTVLEVLYHSRLPRGQQSSPSWLSRLYSGVTLEEVCKGVIRGQEKAQCRSSRMPGEEKTAECGAECKARGCAMRSADSDEHISELAAHSSRHSWTSRILHAVEVTSSYIQSPNPRSSAWKNHNSCLQDNLQVLLRR